MEKSMQAMCFISFASLLQILIETGDFYTYIVNDGPLKKQLLFGQSTAIFTVAV